MLPDPSIVIAMQHALVHTPPAIMRSMMDVGSSIERFRVRNEKRLAAAEAELTAWLQAGIRERETMWAAFRDNPVTEGHMQALDEFIAAIDKRTAQDEREFLRCQKKVRRHAKQFLSVSAQAYEVVDGILSRTIALMAREYRERMDFGLFLRALRAEHDPRARGGPIFGDPRELGRYLRAALN